MVRLARIALGLAVFASFASTAHASGVVASDNVLYRLTPHPKGIVFYVHGGGWYGDNAADLTLSSLDQSFFADRGWDVYAIDYRSGRDSLEDVMAAYELLHRVTDLPVCALGYSAGGNLALLLADHEPSLKCVISEASPTDLVNFAHQNTWSPTGASTVDTQIVWNQMITLWFGIDHSTLERWSPVDQCSHLKAHVLLGTSTTDPYVPQQQATEFATHCANAHAYVLPGVPTAAPTNFTHTNVTLTALVRWHRLETAMLERTINATQYEGAQDA